MRFKNCLMYCMCQHYQSIYITSHNASVFITLIEVRFKWEVSSVWFTVERWQWPTGCLWSNQVLNQESLVAQPQSYPPFSNLALSLLSWWSEETTASPLGDLSLPEGKLPSVPSCSLWRRKAALTWAALTAPGLFFLYRKAAWICTPCSPSPLLCLSSPRTHLRAARHGLQAAEPSRHTVNPAGWEVTTDQVLFHGSFTCFLFLLKCQQDFLWL